MHFILYPYLYVNHFRVNAVCIDHLNFSSSCFAVILHVSPRSEYSVVNFKIQVGELMPFLQCFVVLPVCFVHL